MEVLFWEWGAKSGTVLYKTVGKPASNASMQVFHRKTITQWKAFNQNILPSRSEITYFIRSRTRLCLHCKHSILEVP